MTTTYADLDRQVDLIAAGLAERGIGQGNAVALLMDNRPDRYGATILIAPRFHPVEILELIRTQRATCLAGVPTMYNYMLQLPTATQKDVESIRVCCSGGASMPVELLHKFEEKFGVQIVEGYGLSEAAPATAFNPIRGVRKAGSVGVDIPGVHNRVVDPEGNELPRGEVGELVVRGPNVMMGYLGLPEDTKAALQDGWLYTGDLARMDDDIPPSSRQPLSVSPTRCMERLSKRSSYAKKGRYRKKNLWVFAVTS